MRVKDVGFVDTCIPVVTNVKEKRRSIATSLLEVLRSVTADAPMWTARHSKETSKYQKLERPPRRWDVGRVNVETTTGTGS